MREFIRHAHILWLTSLKEKSLASSRCSRKSEGRTGRSVHSVIYPASDSCWVSKFLDYPFLLQRISQTEFETSDQQSENFATLVPDAILCCSNLLQKEVESFIGVVLLADITGFTFFCEEHGRHERDEESVNTMSKLTATLNGHLGTIVQLVYSSGGDVIKFSGDAILALWKVYTDQFMYKVIHEAIACAHLIQRKLSGNVDPKVKLAISAGNLSFGVIGTERSRHYVLVGPPVHELKKADGVCESGEVVLCPSAWNHCSPHNYHYTMSKADHVTVRQIVDKSVTFRWNVGELNSSTFMSAGMVAGSNSAQCVTEINQIREKTLRPSITESLGKDLASCLRPFVIPPVVQQIEADQPLEYLTEMRQVTSMFINLLPSENLEDRQLIQLVDDVYCTVNRLVARALGCLTKVSLFDKDVMLLAVFGLRGFKHEQESRRSLRCGLHVKQAVAQIPGVGIVSVGITTGMAYCGVVGHPMRREYTVIGSPVNKAARIMCAYPDCVTCDRATLLQSNLPVHFFDLREQKEIKGIEVVGPIYEYTEGLGHCPARLSTQEVVRRPLLGRDNLMGELECLLHATAIREPHRLVQAVVLQGDAGVGKTRVLHELVLKAEFYGLHAYAVTFQPRHGTTPYSALQHVCQQMLEANDSLSIEQFMLLLKGTNPFSFSNEDISLLVQILSQSTLERGHLSQLSQVQKRERLPLLIFSLLQLVFTPMIIAIDDLHLMDDHTWQLCSDILELQHIRSLQKAPTLIIATFSPRDSCCISQALRSILLHPAVMVRALSGLPVESLAPLACQLLSSDGIHEDVVEILDVHSRGNPGWCATYLNSVIQSEGLQVQPISRNAMLIRQDFVVPDPVLLYLGDEYGAVSQCALKRAKKPGSESLCSALSGYQTRESQRDDVAASASALDMEEVNSATVIVITNRIDCEKKAALLVNDVIVSSFDCLRPYDQLVLKCAAVVAHTYGGLFTKDMLLFLLQSVHGAPGEKTSASMKHLFHLGVLECASRFRDEENGCPACSADITDSSPSTVLLCKLLCFQMDTFQRAIYDLLPGNQRKRFHMLAIECLERSWKPSVICQGCLTVQSSQPWLKIKYIYYMTEYGFMSVLSGNPLEAVRVLGEAQSLLQGMLLQDGDVYSDRDLCVTLLGKVLTVTAQAWLSLGDTEQAHLCVSQALATLGVPWPQESRLLRGLRWRPRPRPSGERRVQQAASLALLSDFYSASEAYRMSRDAAVASLRIALTWSGAGAGEEAHIALCTAVSCVLESSVLSGHARSTCRIEQLGLRCVQQYAREHSPLAGRFFARLLYAVFVRRLCQGELVAAHDAGMLVLDTSEKLCSRRATLFILPLLIRNSLMIGGKGKAFSNLQKLKTVSEQNIDDESMRKISDTNYHILRLDLLLDAGNPTGCDAQLIVVQEAAKFVLSLLTTEQEDTHEQSIMVRLWLWFARRNDWTVGTYWQGLIGQSRQTLSDWSALRHLEVLLVAEASNRGSSPDFTRTLLTQLHRDAKGTPLLLPRLLHLLAYRAMLRGGLMRLPLSLHYLTMAKRLARKQGNVLEMEWCRHTREVWVERHTEQMNEKYFSFLVPRIGDQ